MEQRDEKWRKHRLAAERWKATHRDYYLRQKRRLAGRPEYLALRRLRYARSKVQREDIVERKPIDTYDSPTNDEAGHRLGHSGWDPSPGAPLGDWAGAPRWTQAQGADISGGASDKCGQVLL